MREEHWVDDGTELGIAYPCCGKPFEDYIHATEYVSLTEIPNYCPNCGTRLKNKWEE